MIYIKKHTVLVSSVVVLGLALLFALPQLNQQQDLRQRAQTPSGNQLYVSPTGTGDCTQASPCTLATANDKAAPGATILAAPGTYNGTFTTTKGGTAGNFITFKSQTKHGATFTGTAGNKNENGVNINHEYIRFQEFTVTGADIRDGIEIGANNVEVIGNHIHTITQFKTGGTGFNGGSGVDTNKSPLANVLIDGNHIHHVGAPGSTEQLIHGMYLASHVTNGRVTNNIIHDVEDFGLHPYDETEASGWHFINNTIVNTGRGILQAPNGVTRNNIVFNTRGAAYDIRGSGNVVENNLAGGTGAKAATGVTMGDPMFVSASDFHIKPGSPAIDKGSAEGAPKTDYDGKTRPQGAGIDLGAYEDGGAAASPGAANPSGAVVNPSSALPSSAVVKPSFYPLAPCPSCVTPSITPMGSGTPSYPTGIATVPSNTVASPEPSSIEPCEEDSSISDNHKKKKKSKHKNNKGSVSTGFEEILKLLLELISKLIELLGGQPTQTPQPSEEPIEPSEPEEPEPSAAAPANPC